MKIIEFRRHSIRIRPSPHLTQEGVMKARKVGDTLGEFNLVLSSNAPRAVETAVAMGYAVDKIVDEISKALPEIEDEVTWGMDFVQYRDAIRKGCKTAEYATKMVLFVKDIANLISEGESALVVGHGGWLEITTIGCFPQEEYEKWGDPLDTCEGIRMYITNNEFEKIELLRA